jgi:hypothetical protein
MQYFPGPHSLNRKVLSTRTVQPRDEQATTSATSQTLLGIVELGTSGAVKIVGAMYNLLTGVVEFFG